LDWHDQVAACGGKCAQRGDLIVAYCGVTTTDGGVVTTTLTLQWTAAGLERPRKNHYVRTRRYDIAQT